MGKSILSQAVGVLSKDSFKKQSVRIAWTGFEGDDDEAIVSSFKRVSCSFLDYFISNISTSFHNRNPLSWP